ncbi:hypothetical protein ACH47B_38770 [Rhodococcus sp. NPDC019627]|uniref:hypothetical protein n=1 Tax=unclassified Rhodococcus (in: high G+C Gram-positive bacteria) TaxID=192944 RepID=UPI0037B3C3E1
MRSARGAGDGRSAGERAQPVRRREPCRIVADLGQDPGGENRTETRSRPQDLRERVAVEFATQRVLEAVGASPLSEDIMNTGS